MAQNNPKRIQLGQGIKERRDKLDLTQGKLLEQLNKHHERRFGETAYANSKALSRIENGERDPKRSALIVMLVDIFGEKDVITINGFMDGYGFKTPKDDEIADFNLKVSQRFETPTKEIQSLAESALSGLIALYGFMGDATDITGNGHNGTAFGDIRYKRGGKWHAGVFDGKTTHIRVPDHPSLRLEQFTLVAWINPTKFQSGNRIVEKGNSNCYWMDINPDGKVLVGIRGHRYYPFNLVSPESLQIGSWHFIAGTFDGTTQELYVDSDVVNWTKHGQTIAPNQNDEPLMIGWKFNGIPQDRFCGLIHEVRIYNRALSKSELDDFYHTSIPSEMDWNPNKVEDVAAAN